MGATAQVRCASTVAFTSLKPPSSYRIADGKLAEHWEVADFAKFQEQLTAKPSATAFKSFQSTLKS